MNPITLKSMAVFLAAAGLLLLAAACGHAPSDPTSPAQLTTQAAETDAAEAAADAPAPSAPVQTETEPPQEKPQEEHFLLTFVGDCTLGCSPSNYYADLGFIKTVGEDYAYPFRNVAGYFQNDEFTMLNLEGPLCDTGVPVQKTHTFRGPTLYVNILTQNSVEAVTVANNHTMDYGQTGYTSTLAALEDAGVPYVERDSSAIVTTENGLTIGLYGMTYYRLDTEDMVSQIAAMKEQGVDLIIVVPHWGTEGSYQPTAEQEQVGHAAIDAGADIVYGSHPHVLQPIEEYNDGIIYYSLGNFSFGGNSCPDDFDTALLQQEVIRDADGRVRLGELTVVPACISSVSGRNNYQPTPYEAGTEAFDRVLQKLAGTWSP